MKETDFVYKILMIGTVAALVLMFYGLLETLINYGS